MTDPYSGSRNLLLIADMIEETAAENDRLDEERYFLGDIETLEDNSDVVNVRDQRFRYYGGNTKCYGDLVVVQWNLGDASHPWWVVDNFSHHVVCRLNAETLTEMKADGRLNAWRE